MRREPFRIALVGTFPPTACGIATFTQSLRQAVMGRESSPHAFSDTPVFAEVIRLVEGPSRVPEVGVVAEWVRDDSSSLLAALQVANRYDCVILQHEFGIYGGTDGSDVVGFVESCSVPVIVVLHTVVPSPTARQRSIVDQIVGAAALAVVQTDAARTRLVANHDVDPGRLTVIPHGAAANFDGPVPDLGVDGPVVLTWGLIGPGKGIAHGIRAMALLAERDRIAPTYVVAGRTHPNVLANEGERYREGLVGLCEELGVRDKVVLDARYRDWNALRATIRAADVVLLPYDSRDQVTSGVLVEAIASAHPVVATAFPHAVEALRSGAGIVVPHDDPSAIADALSSILGAPARQRHMRWVARSEATSLLWPRIGQQYLARARAVAGTTAAA